MSDQHLTGKVEEVKVERGNCINQIFKEGKREKGRKIWQDAGARNGINFPSIYTPGIIEVFFYFENVLYL